MSQTLKVLLSIGLFLLSAFSEMEIGFIRERTVMGLQRAKAQGKILGRKKNSISSNTQFEPYREKIFELLDLGLSYDKVVKHIGVGSRSALYSFVKNRK